MTPDVSVVIISFNDVERLPRAVASVQRQSLRSLEIIVVDDASADDTEQVVRAIAARDPRVRYERLPENSGGCSAPRNRGLDLARAAWVMFCDSDDEYERHACKNLLEAAERTGADVVCGTAERVDVRTGRVRRWRPEVHVRTRVADGLVDLPEILNDTISVNKIYRTDLLRRHGIRFPEGLLFEDQLFTLEAMAAANRIATIPEVVYRWYVDRLSDEPSITQRRNEARNVESRIEINRRIDRFLTSRDLTDVQAVKDEKFLRHDVYLYLSSMLEVDDVTASELMNRLAPYVESVNLRPAWRLRTGLRVAIYHLLARDLEGVRSAMRFVKWASVVDVPVVARDGREYWSSPQLADGPTIDGRSPRDWLDVTDLHLLGIPFTQRRFLHRLEAIDVIGSGISVTGSTVDYDGSLADATAVELRFLVGGDRTALSVPGEWTGWDGVRRTWRADGPLADHLERALEEKDRGTVGVAISRGELVNVTSARSPEAEVARTTVPFPGRARWTGTDALAITPYDNGAVGWRAVRTAAWRTRLLTMQGWWFRLPGTTRLATVTGLFRRDVAVPVAGWVGRRLPRRRLAVLEVDAGRSFDGNVRAVADALRRGDPGMALVWVHRASPGRVPEGATPVERQSVRHAWLLSRSTLRIDDGSSPALADPGSRTLAVNAGSGAPVHRIGLDDPSVLVSRSAIAAARRGGRQWGLVLAPSTASGQVIAAAYEYRGAVAAVGLPRLDAAVAALAEGRARLRERLDLPDDRPVLLWAPARRPDRRPGEALLDLEDWAEELGERAYLLVRDRPVEGPAVPTRLRFAVRDVGHEDDVIPFLAASDLLIADYAPLVGDAAALDLSVVLHQPDRDAFVGRTRGVYPGVDDAGPITRSQADLIAEITDWLDDPARWDGRHAPARRAWARWWVGPADGHAADRAVQAIHERMDRP